MEGTLEEIKTQVQQQGTNLSNNIGQLKQTLNETQAKQVVDRAAAITGCKSLYSV